MHYAGIAIEYVGIDLGCDDIPVLKQVLDTAAVVARSQASRLVRRFGEEDGSFAIGRYSSVLGSIHGVA